MARNDQNNTVNMARQECQICQNVSKECLSEAISVFSVKTVLLTRNKLYFLYFSQYLHEVSKMASDSHSFLAVRHGNNANYDMSDRPCMRSIVPRKWPISLG